MPLNNANGKVRNCSSEFRTLEQHDMYYFSPHDSVINMRRYI